MSKASTDNLSNVSTTLVKVLGSSEDSRRRTEELLSAPVTWNGESLEDGPLSEKVIMEIIWDLTEINL